MPRLLVPTIGTMMTLTRDWTFTLFSESRNSTLLAALGQFDPNERLDGDYDRTTGRTVYKSMHVTLPIGTVLRVDRIYIRQGQEDYDSLTFIVESTPLKLNDTMPTQKWKYDFQTGAGAYVKGMKKNKKPRFWAKLYDVNNMECDIKMETLPT